MGRPAVLADLTLYFLAIVFITRFVPLLGRVPLERLVVAVRVYDRRVGMVVFIFISDTGRPFLLVAVLLTFACLVCTCFLLVVFVLTNSALFVALFERLVVWLWTTPEWVVVVASEEGLVCLEGIALAFLLAVVVLLVDAPVLLSELRLPVSALCELCLVKPTFLVVGDRPVVM